MVLHNRTKSFLAACGIAVGILALSLPAIGASTTFFTSNNGDVVFPISPPTTSPAAPGAIDNMAIGTTTRAPGAFSTLTVGTNQGLTCPSFAPLGAPAAATDTAFFVATRPFLVVAASEVHAVAAGGASALQVTKDIGTNAPGAGTDLLTVAFDLNATANTVQAGTLVTGAALTLAAGDRLSVDFAQAIQSTSGLTVTVCLAPR